MPELDRPLGLGANPVSVPLRILLISRPGRTISLKRLQVWTRCILVTSSPLIFGSGTVNFLETEARQGRVAGARLAATLVSLGLLPDSELVASLPVREFGSAYVERCLAQTLASSHVYTSTSRRFHWHGVEAAHSSYRSKIQGGRETCVCLCLQTLVSRRGIS